MSLLRVLDINHLMFSHLEKPELRLFTNELLKILSDIHLLYVEPRSILFLYSVPINLIGPAVQHLSEA
jgi:hypothetical protein